LPKMSLPSPVIVHYFDGPTLGGSAPVCLLLADAGIDFTNHRISREEWPALKQQAIDSGASPAGTLPYITIGTEEFAQTAAIIGYLAEELGYVGTTAVDRRKLALVMDVLRDFIMQALRARFGGVDGALEAYLGGDAHRYLAAVEAYLVKFGSGPYVLGDKIGYTDIMLFTTVMGFKPHGLEKYPKFKAVVDAVGAREKIHKYLVDNGFSH